MNVNKKEVLSYAFLPQVLPRFKDLFASGFQWFAYLVAHIYYAVRLLPAGHPYLDPNNQGKYGLRHVIAAAANNLTFDRKHIDQLLMFGIVMVGVMLLFGQIILLIFGLVFSNAEAGMFETQFPQSDNAFMILDYVFGIPGFFGSCALGDPAGASIAPCANIPAFGDPTEFAFHAGLHSLLEFYSWSLLFVGILIFLYFITVVLAETASTGVPFGARFNTAWAPIRLLVAIGLLVPIAYGLNSGQYLTLAIAKLGSGLATNAWYGYNDTIAAQAGYNFPNPAGYNAEGNGGNAALLPRPQTPDVSGYVAMMQVIKACQYSYMKRYGYGVPPANEQRLPIQAWAVKPGVAPVLLSNHDGTNFAGGVEFYDATGAASSVQDAYETLLEFFDYGDITVTFGKPRIEGGGPGGIIVTNEIEPLCGEVKLPVTTAVPITIAGGDAAGAWDVQRQYYAMVMFDWTSSRAMAFGARYAEAQSTGMPQYNRPCMITPGHLSGGTTIDTVDVLETMEHRFIPPGNNGCDEPPNTEDIASYYTSREGLIDTQIEAAWVALQNVVDLFVLEDSVRERGWAGAGMWYNNLASVIGREFDAVDSLPYLSKFPFPMEEVKRIKMSGEATNVSGAEVYNPSLGGGESVAYVMNARDADIAKTLYHVYKDFTQNAISLSNLSALADKNLMISAMHGIFGTRSLMSIRDEENREVHPMAQLIAIGKDLVNSTLTNLLSSTGFAIAGGIYEASGDSSSAVLSQAVSSALSTVAMVGLTAGFLLFYVLPFMPFLYFFFAVGTWVKTIFEAMVGVPLWALAHIRIDSEGLPGDAAANGYFLLLEIFIRPIMCVFGLIASFVIFGALVSVLHEIFELVVDNVMGFDNGNLNVDLGVYTLTLENRRSMIDEFFFTIMYVMMVYVLGLSCFKLIDMIPNSILRWAGAGVKSFGDTYQDPAESLTQYAAIGGYVVGERAIGAVGRGAEVAGSLAGQAGMRLPTMPMYQGQMRLAAARRAASGQAGGNTTP